MNKLKLLFLLLSFYFVVSFNEGQCQGSGYGIITSASSVVTSPDFQGQMETVNVGVYNTGGGIDTIAIEEYLPRIRQWAVVTVRDISTSTSLTTLATKIVAGDTPKIYEVSCKYPYLLRSKRSTVVVNAETTKVEFMPGGEH